MALVPPDNCLQRSVERNISHASHTHTHTHMHGSTTIIPSAVMMMAIRDKRRVDLREGISPDICPNQGWQGGSGAGAELGGAAEGLMGCGS